LEITADLIVKAFLGIVAAGGLGGNLYQGFDCQKQVDVWQEEVSRVRTSAEAREIRDSDMCLELLEISCEVE
jgi:hypothetical protein